LLIDRAQIAAQKVDTQDYEMPGFGWVLEM